MSGATTGGVRVLLRAEAAFVLIVGLLAYARFGAGWGTFALWFLVPDLSLLGYLAGPRTGAFAYNCAHSYLVPLAALVLGAAADAGLLVAVGLVWCCHIGFDRMLGYGLKYSAGFGFTHLGRIGRDRRVTGVRRVSESLREPA